MGFIKNFRLWLEKPIPSLLGLNLMAVMPDTTLQSLAVVLSLHLLRMCQNRQSGLDRLYLLSVLNLGR